MPELPEVETVVRALRPLLDGRSITSVRSGKRPLRLRWQRAWGGFLIGLTVSGVERRGKWIHIRLAPAGHLVFHLGMTGQLTVVPTRQKSLAHTHLVFGLDAGECDLRFRDVRRLGGARVLKKHDALEKFFASTKLGPEPFMMNPEDWRAGLQGRDDV